MAKKYKEPKEEPMSAVELLFVSQLAKTCGFKRENIIDSKGTFPSLRVITNGKFKKDEINVIQNGFKQRFKRVLLFNERNETDNKDIKIGYFTKKSLAK